MTDPRVDDRGHQRQPPADGDAGRPDGSALVPAMLSSFVGREQELLHLRDLLRLPGVRLVTLTGPGGVGKTRLALRAVEGLWSHYPDGITFVDLTPVRVPSQVLPAIAQVLGLPPAGDQPIEKRLVDALQGCRQLLVLDNFEQVIDAARAIGRLLAACRWVNVLATSREVLRLSMEQVVAVPPLEVPHKYGSGSTAHASSAVALFIDRAHAIREAFAPNAREMATIAEICRRLDGLPLAIELAAARVSHLPPDALLKKLDRRLPLLTGGVKDLPVRQHTIRAAIAWSYDLLSPHEQMLFRRCSVFVGGFDLEAAIAVSSRQPANDIEVLDDLASLVGKSLLQLDGAQGSLPRYSMLETIREFGFEQLETCNETRDVRECHVGWCLALIEQAEPELEGPESRRWLERLDRELPNLRAAMRWSFASGDPAAGQRIAATLGWLWWVRGNPEEGRAWLEQALNQGASALNRMSAHLRTKLAEIEWALGNYDRAVSLDEEAIAIWRTLGDEAGMGACMMNLGRVAHDTGDFARAVRHYTESIDLYRVLGDEWNIIRGLSNLAMVRLLQGDVDLAISLQTQALERARCRNLAGPIAKGAFNLGEMYRQRGDYRQASPLFREGIARHGEQRERRFMAQAIRSVARLAADIDLLDDAAQLVGADEALRESIGARITPEPERQTFELFKARLRAAIGNTAFESAQLLGRGVDVDDAIVRAIDTAARVDQRVQRHTRALNRDTCGLSTREREVLHLVATGRSDREIGEALFISHRTVNGHVANIFAKLGVRSRAEAAVAAARLGLLPNEIH